VSITGLWATARRVGRAHRKQQPGHDARQRKRVPPVLRLESPARVQLHSALPPTLAWTYDGHLPGPTIEVRRGQAVEIEWVNALTGAFPVTVVRCGATPSHRGQEEGLRHPQNEPGSTSGNTGDFLDDRVESLAAMDRRARARWPNGG
jgi:hypothetical protein